MTADHVSLIADAVVGVLKNSTWTNLRSVLLCDFNGNVKATTAPYPRSVYWHSLPGQTREVGTAVLPGNSEILYQENSAYLSNPPQITIGYPERSAILTVKGVSSSLAGLLTQGNDSQPDQALSQSQFPSVQNLAEFRVGVSPIAGLNEVFVNPGTYTVPGTGVRAQWLGATTALIQSAITALASSGHHQIGWITFDDSGGALHLETNTAAAPVGTLPSRSEFTDAVIMAITTTYKKMIPLYLYDGQALVEADIYRRMDCRVDWFPGQATATDTAAVHVNVANEISGVTVKSTPVSGDLLLIEDSAASGVKKKVTVGSLPGSSGTDANAIHVNVANEISGITAKATPVSGDLLVIEDSAASGVKKKITVGSLPGGGGSVVYPKRATMWHDEALVTSGGAINTGHIDTGQVYNVTAYQLTPSSTDKFTNGFFIAAGTYTFFVFGETGSDHGKVDWYIDGTIAVSGQDWYAASGARNVLQSASVTVATDGWHKLEGRVNGKNAGSTNYYLEFTKYFMQPSAD